VAAVLIILYAGVIWMTSQGNEERSHSQEDPHQRDHRPRDHHVGLRITALFSEPYGDNLTGPLGDSGDGGFFAQL